MVVTLELRSDYFKLVLNYKANFCSVVVYYRQRFSITMVVVVVNFIVVSLLVVAYADNIQFWPISVHLMLLKVDVEFVWVRHTFYCNASKELLHTGCSAILFELLFCNFLNLQSI